MQREERGSSRSTKSFENPPGAADMLITLLECYCMSASGTRAANVMHKQELMLFFTSGTMNMGASRY